MDKLSGVSRSIAAAPSLEHLPGDVLEKILHYLPVKLARNTFRLVNRNFLVGTDYLRTAGMLQTQIRNKVATESQRQAESHLASLISDCMNGAFPVALRCSMIMELIGTLPQLPAAAHADAMRVVLARCETIGEQTEPAFRQQSRAQCIHAYQRRSEQEPQLLKFTPANDEDARIAAGYFTEIDITAVPLKQVVSHLDHLLAAMDWADAMDDSEEGERALIILCEHCTDTFAQLNDAPASLKKDAAWGQLQALKTPFAQKALLLVPVRSMVCQAALVSVTLDLAEQASAMRRQAEKDGRDLILKTPDAMLSANLVALARSLFRKGVINTVIKRVEAWPDPVARLAMLRQLAIVAWEKGAMDHMERLCAGICKLDPPDAVALQAFMQANMKQLPSVRLEMATRDVMPYMLCVPSGLARVAALETLGMFLLVFLGKNQSARAQARFFALLEYSNRVHATLINTYYNSDEAELERRADAAKSTGGRAAAGAASSTTDPRTNPTYQAAMRMLKELKKQN